MRALERILALRGKGSAGFESGVTPCQTGRSCSHAASLRRRVPLKQKKGTFPDTEHSVVPVAVASTSSRNGAKTSASRLCHLCADLGAHSTL